MISFIQQINIWNCSIIILESDNYLQMKGKSQRKAIFSEIGKSITQQKTKFRKQTHSLIQHLPSGLKQMTPSTAPHINQNYLPSKRKTSLPCPTKINTTVAVASGMNDGFLYMRKQNHLNTCFNLRKNKLKEITKQNKEIYNRINSQKSIYSSTDLNKSFQQTVQLRKRLSQSKLSKRSITSRSSSSSRAASGKGNRFALKKKNQPEIQIKAGSINSVKQSDLKSFKGLFFGDNATNKQKQTDKKQYISELRTSRKDQLGSKPIKQSYGKTVQAIVSQTAEQHPAKMGGILHRIAEVMFTGDQKSKNRKSNGYMRAKKTFVF